MADVPPAVGLPAWAEHSLPRADGGGNLTVLAVPAVHGPEDGERDAIGSANCEVFTKALLDIEARLSQQESPQAASSAP